MDALGRPNQIGISLLGQIQLNKHGTPCKPGSIAEMQSRKFWSLFLIIFCTLSDILKIFPRMLWIAVFLKFVYSPSICPLLHFRKVWKNSTNMQIIALCLTCQNLILIALCMTFWKFPHNALYCSLLETFNIFPQFASCLTFQNFSTNFSLIALFLTFWKFPQNAWNFQNFPQICPL